MDFKINYIATYGYVITVTLAFFNVGYSYHAFGTWSKIIHSQLVERKMYVIQDFHEFEKIMNIVIPIGAFISAPIIGTLASISRRELLMISSGVFTFGWLLTTIFNLLTILIGRFIMGLWFGAYLTLVPLIVCELSPASISGPLGVIGQIQGMIGFLVSTILQFAHPYSFDEHTSESLIWKITLGLPVIIWAVQLLLLGYVFDYDTPKFYLVQGDNKSYQTTMGRLYKWGSNSHIGLLEDGMFPFVKQRDSSWIEILTYPLNRPMIVGCLFAIFHQAAGISSVTFVSDHLFTRNVDDYFAEYYSREAVLFSGIAGVLAAFTGFIASYFFGRRTIILTGELVMCILLAILSNTSLLKIDVIGEICDVFYVYAFNASLGSMLWLYVSETNGPKAVSWAAFWSSAFVLVFMLFTTYIYHYLSEVGIYFNLFCWQILCVAFMFVYVKETKDCEDKENLYIQKQPMQIFEETKELKELH